MEAQAKVQVLQVLFELLQPQAGGRVQAVLGAAQDVDALDLLDILAADMGITGRPKNRG
jgi:hypothetical protein